MSEYPTSDIKKDFKEFKKYCRKMGDKDPIPFEEYKKMRIEHEENYEEFKKKFDELCTPEEQKLVMDHWWKEMSWQWDAKLQKKLLKEYLKERKNNDISSCSCCGWTLPPKNK